MSAISATYHGGSAGGGRGGAYGGGGGGPSGAGYETVFILAEDIVPNPVPGQNNPPVRMTYLNPVGQFFSVLAFPQPTLGGSWCRFVHYPRALVMTSVNPTFSVLWTCPAVSAPGVVNFHIDWGAFNAGDAIGATGPGTQVNDTALAVDCAQMTAPLSVPNTSGFAWNQGAYLHCNLYRGLAPPDTIVGPVYVLGVRIQLTLA